MALLISGYWWVLLTSRPLLVPNSFLCLFPRSCLDLPNPDVCLFLQAGRRLEVLYSEKGGVPVLFTSPYYVQLMDEVTINIVHRILYIYIFILRLSEHTILPSYQVSCYAWKVVIVKFGTPGVSV